MALTIYRAPNINLTTPTPTATPSPIKLIKTDAIKNVNLATFQYVNKRSELKNVKVTAIDATSITVDNNGTSVKVIFQLNTHYRRRFWGKSSVAEISVGDSVDVVGKWANESRTEIKAVLIRNLSIQKRYGVFFGDVKSITDTGFVMTTIHRGEETITISSSTKIIDRQEQNIEVKDILAGHRVRIKGLWDSDNFTIKEVVEIKDFSLPPVETPEAVNE